jgi:hypothetical protein
MGVETQAFADVRRQLADIDAAGFDEVALG